MKKLFLTTDIRILVYGPAVIGLLILIAGLYTLQLIFPVTPEILRALIVLIMALVSSISGFAQIIRKEMPGRFGSTFHGNFAVISGLMWVIFFLSIAARMLVEIVNLL